MRVNTTPTSTRFINLIPYSASRFSFCTALLCADFKYLHFCFICEDLSASNSLRSFSPLLSQGFHHLEETRKVRYKWKFLCKYWDSTFVLQCSRKTLRNNISETDVRTLGKYGLKAVPLIESFLLLQTKAAPRQHHLFIVLHRELLQGGKKGAIN